MGFLSAETKCGVKIQSANVSFKHEVVLISWWSISEVSLFNLTSKKSIVYDYLPAYARRKRKF